MLHLESTGVRWSGFTKSKCLGVKMKYIDWFSTQNHPWKLKSKSSSSSSSAGCRHNADGAESWRSGCAVSITCQRICPSAAQLTWPASGCPRTSQSSTSQQLQTRNLLLWAIPLLFSHCESDLAEKKEEFSDLWKSLHHARIRTLGESSWKLCDAEALGWWEHFQERSVYLCCAVCLQHWLFSTDSRRLVPAVAAGSALWRI